MSPNTVTSYVHDIRAFLEWYGEQGGAGALSVTRDDVIAYLGKVNEILEGTPFKIAYRTRNEFLLYAVNRLHFATDSELWQTLDEMTSMKILSRIEGDNERCEHVLRELKNLLTETVGNRAEDSASLKKIDEMLAKLKSGYTSYWA